MIEYRIDPEPELEPTPPPVGEVVGSADSTLPVDTDDQGRLAEDVACRACHYNLRGLTLDGQCPECQLSINETLHDGLLRFADARWLGRVSLGLVLLIVAIVAGVVATLGNQMAMASVVMDVVMLEESRALPVWTTGAMIGVMGLQVVAIVLVTSPEPVQARQERFFSSRFIARTAIIGAIILSTVGAVANPMLHAAITGQFTEAVVAQWVMTGCVLLSWGCRGIGILALGDYGAALATRAPADKLARFLRRGAWAYVGVGAILLITLVLAVASDFSGPRSGLALQVMAIFGGALLIVSGIAGIVLMVLMRNRLQTARRLALRREQRLHSGALV